jgi:hypothetical protein
VLRRAVYAQPMNGLQRDSRSSAAGATLALVFFADSHGYFFFASLSTIFSSE